MEGLTTQQAHEQQAKFGKNRIDAHNTRSLFTIFFAQFTTIINAILATATVVSFLLGHTLDGSFLVAVIVINACFGFIQEYRAEKSLEKLKDYAAPLARVIRDGKQQEILAEELVPNDIVVLSEGSRIPADGFLTNVAHLEIDESILSGESFAVAKKNNDKAFLGTLVTKGKASLHVEKIGMQTQFGEIANTLTTITEEKTPLQKDFTHLGRYLSFVAIILGLLVIPTGLLYNHELLPLVLVAASIGIAAIPEGLPAVITIAFAVGTHRMAKRNAIMRKMAAIETLGAIQVILVDKTGTLTQNAMKVKHMWLHHENNLPYLLRACVLGNTASLVEKADKNFTIIGDQTDGAMLLWAKQHDAFPLIPDGNVIDEFIFDENSKTITTLWKQQGKEFVFVKGAPESLIAQSKLTPKERAIIIKQFESFAKQGLRTIGFAMKEDSHMQQKTREHLEENVTFLGFLALYDPPRPEIKEAIAKAHTAGIHVAMVTGDTELTALAIARETGLIEDNDDDVLTGDELASLSDEELETVILKTRIFARTKPEQKLRIATLLQKKGMIVGVTGDGVNDALALKKANVGVAMGKTGTDVAKESSDMILADDNFATLVTAIEEGRIIYKNITNAILYLLSGNLAEVSFVFFATLFNLPFPLLPTQILWINLITDSLPALALATGNRDRSVLSNKPRDPHVRLLNPKRIRLIVTIGLGMTTVLLYMFIFLLQVQTENQARTIVFNALIYFHLIIVIWLGWHSVKKGNRMIIFTIILIAALQLMITYIPFFQGIFHLEL